MSFQQGKENGREMQETGLRKKEGLERDLNVFANYP
jgi:hypothetical protein